MTEAPTQIVCRQCSADIREGSLFCYNCGKSVTYAAENGADNKDDLTDLEKAAAAAEREAPIAGPGKKIRVPSERRRAYNRQPAEVTWTPRNDGANSFVIAGLIIAVLTALLIIAALYYR